MNITLSQFINLYYKKEFQFLTDHCWYDWFCKESSLPHKTRLLANKFMSLLPSSKFDLDNNYIWFKNNCPCVGALYDDFRISDIYSKDVLYTIVPHSGMKIEQDNPYIIWGKENDFKGPIVATNKWDNVIKFFKGAL